MSKETLVFLLGFVVFLTPYIGVPGSYKKWILVVCGALLMCIGYLQRRNAFLRSFDQVRGERRGEVFTEHMGVHTEVPTHHDSSRV